MLFKLKAVLYILAYKHNLCYVYTTTFLCTSDFITFFHNIITLCFVIGIDVTLHAAGDNPIYLTSSAVNGGLSSQTTPAAVTTAANEREDTESSRGEEERRFDDFIYGDDDEIDQQDQQSLPSHEFDNPIY